MPGRRSEYKYDLVGNQTFLEDYTGPSTGYIGSTINPDRRMAKHERGNRSGYRTQWVLGDEEIGITHTSRMHTFETKAIDMARSRGGARFNHPNARPRSDDPGYVYALPVRSLARAIGYSMYRGNGVVEAVEDELASKLGNIRLR